MALNSIGLRCSPKERETQLLRISRERAISGMILRNGVAFNNEFANTNPAIAKTVEHGGFGTAGVETTVDINV